jgi:hypothetical protein
MIRTTLFAGALVAASFAAPTLTSEDVVGSDLPEIALYDFAGTSATSLEDLWGETLLIEFFAYW